MQESSGVIFQEIGHEASGNPDLINLYWRGSMGVSGPKYCSKQGQFMRSN